MATHPRAASKCKIQYLDDVSDLKKMIGVLSLIILLLPDVTDGCGEQGTGTRAMPQDWLVDRLLNVLHEEKEQRMRSYLWLGRVVAFILSAAAFKLPTAACIYSLNTYVVWLLYTHLAVYISVVELHNGSLVHDPQQDDQKWKTSPAMMGKRLGPSKLCRVE